MYTLIFKKIGWKFFVAGAAAAVVSAPFVRPALVGAVKVGLDASDAATGIWSKAKAQGATLLDEANSIKEDAAASRVASTTPVVSDSTSSELLAELRQLREDVASLKTRLAVNEA